MEIQTLHFLLLIWEVTSRRKKSQTETGAFIQLFNINTEVSKLYAVRAPFIVGEFWLGSGNGIDVW